MIEFVDLLGLGGILGLITGFVGAYGRERTPRIRPLLGAEIYSTSRSFLAPSEHGWAVHQRMWRYFCRFSPRKRGECGRTRLARCSRLPCLGSM